MQMPLAHINPDAPRPLVRTAALTYAALSTGVAAFQIALAAGVPWGSYAMGGAFPGQYPPSMRIEAVLAAAVLIAMAAAILSCGGVALPRLARASRWLVWPIVAYGVVGLVLNLATPSGGERVIWAPVALLLLICSAWVALGRRPSAG